MAAHRRTRPSANGCGDKAWREPRRFAWVIVSPGGKALVCKTEDGMLYELPLSCFDSSCALRRGEPVSVKLCHGGHTAVLRFAGGTQTDFAVDWVLHCCEPRYAYYKDHVPSARRARAAVTTQKHLQPTDEQRAVPAPLTVRA